MTLDRQSMEQTEVVLGVFVKNHGLNAAALKLLYYSLKILQAIGIEASFYKRETSGDALFMQAFAESTEKISLLANLGMLSSAVYFFQLFVRNSNFFSFFCVSTRLDFSSPWFVDHLSIEDGFQGQTLCQTGYHLRSG